ncbi:MAG: hypothetical protein EWV61_00170 [Microcystis aeruginosa Ma_AC_P_19900807_S300]|uniref:Similarity. Hypothetical start n=1 Tax=Microcystis aeruginosa (strain PCC 7806) TaxID=267872 RepID=A8YKV4_MICA7|nr:MAG: hypothetical protein EWV61_00170 [Microcystis aeruginosa Ma_AC_P_19900807_S300]CAO90305.1 unnamed protein product [Microcystis aeruginosa PCC 7806]
MSLSKTLLQFQLVYKVLSKDSTFLTYAVIYIFLKNKEIKNIDQHIYITNKKSAIRGFENISGLPPYINTKKSTKPLLQVASQKKLKRGY